MLDIIPFREPFVAFTGRRVGHTASVLRPGGDRHGTRSGQFRPHNVTAAEGAKAAKTQTRANRRREYERDPLHCGNSQVKHIARAKAVKAGLPTN